MSTTHPFARWLPVLFALLLPAPAWAMPLTGFIEGTAAEGWQGAYAVQLLDGTVVTGTDQMSLLGGFSSLPLSTMGCSVSPSCVSVTNLSTATGFTMSVLVLNLTGTASLGSLGTVSWGAQPFWLLPGEPSPTAAVLATTSGTLDGTILAPSTFSFGFNSTLTAAFNSVTDGQALSALRLDFTDGMTPPTSRTLLQGSVFIDNGIPVTSPASLTAVSIPEPSSLLFFGLALMAVALTAVASLHGAVHRASLTKKGEVSS